jgi:UDP-2-acetamido-3-amino-2,3-dideoxy-glucuronate N-acetyltransferase
MTRNIPQIALIGCGLWGRNIARNLSNLDALAGVHDLNNDAASCLAKEFQTKMMSFDDILSDSTINGVAIVTPALTHCDLAVAALNADKAVYIEKPLTLDVEDAKNIAAAAVANNKQVMVGHLIRHHVAFQHLLALVENGTIGTLKHISASRIASGRIRDTESVLFDLCPHDLALVAALTNQEKPNRVQCHGFSHITDGIEDGVMAQLHFPSGVTASIQANWLNPVKIHDLTVIGDKGAIVFDDTRGWDEKLHQFKFEVLKDGHIINVDSDAGTAIPITPAEPLKDEMRNFIETACQGTPPLTDITEALHVQHIMAAMQNDLMQNPL